jgi:hypothetical protein
MNFYQQGMFMTGSDTEDRPLIGIVIGGLFGIVSLATSVAQQMRRHDPIPDGQVGELMEQFPEFLLVSRVVFLFGYLLSFALLVGVSLSFLRHPAGNPTVRTTSFIAITISLLAGAALLFLVARSPNWATLQDTMRLGLYAAILSLTFISPAIWWLMLFLFRKSRWG